MPNISDLNPEDISESPPGPIAGPSLASSQEPEAPSGVSGNIADLDPSSVQSEDDYNEQKYGTVPQKLLGGLEQIGQGVAGAAIPALEESTGLTTGADIRGRQQALGYAAPLLQGAGLVGSALVPGLGEASLAGLAGNIGEHAAALLPDATGAITNLAATGIKTGAEMAALSTNDELSKMVTGDPDQTLGNAAIRVGLSGILGGAGGTVIGSLSPLWSTVSNRLPVLNTMKEMLGEMKFWADSGVSPLEGAVKDTNGQINSAQEMMYGGMKPELVSKLTESADPAKISAHGDALQNIIDSADPALAENPRFKRAAQTAIDASTPKVDPITLEHTLPNPTDAFRATDNFKRIVQDLASPAYAPPIFQAAMTPEARALAYSAKDIAAAIRPTLEDSSVWGAAGTAQKTINKAMSPMFDLIHDFMKTVASKEAGEGVADPGKLETLLNQTEKGKGSAVLKANKVNNLLRANKDLADAINGQYLANGLEPPFDSQINDTPYLNRILNNPQTTGVKLAQWMRRNGASSLAGEVGHVAGGGVGAGLGFLVGHPMVGAYIGDRLLKPIISGLAKPFAENAVSSEGAKTAVEYLSHVANGQKIFNDAVVNFFKPGELVLVKDLIPDQASRDKLDKSLEIARNPASIMNAGGSLGHYLPGHATAATKTASNAANYFESIKPKQQQTGMIDDPTPIDKNAQSKYNRALDVAQQPLVVLQHAKNGTLIPQDIQTLQTIYPKLRQVMAQKLGQELVSAKANKTIIPYQQKLGIAAIMGQPVDSMMSQPAMMSIVAANSPAADPQAPIGKPKKVSNSTASSMLKVSSLYQTPEQSRAESGTRDIGS